jgi:hypothetical protein
MDFIEKTCSLKDKEIFFGPIESNDNFVFIGDNWIMAHVLHAAGIFTSVSQARKNGWNKPIPNGFTALEVGKKANKKNIFILKD